MSGVMNWNEAAETVIRKQMQRKGCLKPRKLWLLMTGDVTTRTRWRNGGWWQDKPGLPPTVSHMRAIQTRLVTPQNVGFHSVCVTCGWRYWRDWREWNTADNPDWIRPRGRAVSLCSLQLAHGSTSDCSSSKWWRLGLAVRLTQCCLL